MAVSYPEFHGRKDEDIEDFLEKMEMACISNHVQAPAQMLRLLQICLKGDARPWSRSHEEELQMADPPIQVTWDILRQALTENFVRLEDPDKVWHEIQGLKQQEAKPIDDYIKKFSLLWESLCQALQPQGAPPDMMKKDRFLAGLKENLRWRVELKKPRTYEDTLEVARNKEWKIKRLTQLGVSSLPGVPKMKQDNFVQSRGQEEVHRAHVIPVVAPVVPPIVTPIQDDGTLDASSGCLGYHPPKALCLHSKNHPYWLPSQLISLLPYYTLEAALLHSRQAALVSRFRPPS
ncbi:hypothetical protein L7F22_053741 [Adiantum nelumboides]|nr:hypothetical protein [Adiantum nelumboides]